MGIPKQHLNLNKRQVKRPLPHALRIAFVLKSLRVRLIFR